jgi:hypothetical protein
MSPCEDIYKRSRLHQQAGGRLVICGARLFQQAGNFSYGRMIGEPPALLGGRS